MSGRDDDIIGNFDKAITRMEKKIMMVMESVLVDIVNFIKTSGPGNWIDQTGNLRNSIGYVRPFRGSPDDVSKSVSLVDNKFQKVTYSASDKLDSSSITGVVYAGMEYAIYVEYTAGKWVLGGAFEEYRHKILEIIKNRLNQL